MNREKIDVHISFMAHYINTTAIAQRGGTVHSDADFLVVQCTKCSAQFLYDEESLILYFDLQDLNRQVLNIQTASPLPCPEWRDAAWDFIECESDLAVRNGRWGWILR